jgi:Tol biopolymer transport system component
VTYSLGFAALVVATALPARVVGIVSVDQSPGPGIAFAAMRTGNVDVYALNSRGGQRRRLTEHPADDIAPAWSRDRQRIAFASKRDGVFQIYVMNADGSRQRRVTRRRGASAFPTRSPSGRKIAFISDRDGNLEIYVMNADGG